MKKLLLSCFCTGLFALLQAQTDKIVQIEKNASKPVATVTRLFNGTNIEDLNNQTNGGIFSQLLHGEAFEENIDLDFLNLPVSDYVKVYVILDEMRRPHFLSTANAYTRPAWNNLTEKYDFNSKDIYAQVNPDIRPTQNQPVRPNRPLEIGPVDERRVCFRSGFNPYATHSFGLIELCKVAEAIGAQAMVGMSMDETYEDISDFVEYMNGPVTTRWGKLRADHGHPAPLNLKYIEVDNERSVSRGYVECMKKFALAAWESDPEMHIVASLNIGTNLSGYARGSAQYNLASEVFGWFIKQGRANNMVWDPHYSGAVGFSDNPGFSHEMGMDIQAELAIDYPGYKLTLCPMEENGSRCDWDRGLAHAHNWNTLQRNGNCFTWLGTANTFQPHGQHYMWDQGRIHYTSNEIWFQPSAYIDEKMSKDWLPIVVEATSSNDAVLDVTAKMNNKKDSLSIYVVNLNDSAQKAVINVAGFRFSGKAQTWVIGDCELTTLNTVSNKEAVAPKTGSAAFSKKNSAYTFPKYSYTVLTLKR
jgi:hypothetical protein